MSTLAPSGTTASCAGAVTVKVKRACSPGTASRNGCEAGVTVQPAGASSRTVPAARGRAAVSSTITGRVAPGAKSRTPAMNRSETGAMTSSRRRSAGLAGSAAGPDDPIELLALVAHDGIRGERGEPAADREQRGHASGRVLRVERRDLLVDRPRDLGAARHAVPRRVYTVEEIVRRRIAGEQHERLDPRALVHGRAADAEALRLVHAPAAGGDRCERLARHRVPAAHLD